MNKDEAKSPLDWMVNEIGWTKVELTVDSGAVNTVGPPSVAPNVNTVPGEASKRGVRYRVVQRLPAYWHDHAGY